MGLIMRFIFMLYKSYEVSDHRNNNAVYTMHSSSDCTNTNKTK